MGRSRRERPQRLAAKLLKIRQMLGFSQSQMLAVLGLNDKVFYSAISGYELGTREPPLLIVLKYARIVGVAMDVLVDDELDLPDKIRTIGGKEV
jgi:transcriptional regulator with XRE-family HTH domain